MARTWYLESTMFEPAFRETLSCECGKNVQLLISLPNRAKFWRSLGWIEIALLSGLGLRAHGVRMDARALARTCCWPAAGRVIALPSCAAAAVRRRVRSGAGGGGGHAAAPRPSSGHNVRRGCLQRGEDGGALAGHRARGNALRRKHKTQKTKQRRPTVTATHGADGDDAAHH